MVCQGTEALLPATIQWRPKYNVFLVVGILLCSIHVTRDWYKLTETDADMDVENTHY